MANPPLVEVRGTRELRRTMKAAGDDLSDLKDVHQAAGQIVVGRAQQLAPKKSGALAGSIRATRQAGGVSVKAGSNGIPYVNAIHWGWRARNIAPTLFLTNAAAQTETEWVALYEEALDKIIGRIEGDT